MHAGFWLPRSLKKKQEKNKNKATQTLIELQACVTFCCFSASESPAHLQKFLAEVDIKKKKV